MVQYRKDIDGLRAIAVISVLIYHAFPSVLPGGFIGVDIFFVISGYLISGILLKSSKGGYLSIKEFYFRRFRRIFPALFTVLLASLVLGFLLLLPDELALFGKQVIGGEVFISNILLMRESGYFDLSARFKPLLHLWSLGLEEQFYLIWPLMILGLRKFKLSTTKWIVVIGGISLGLNLALLSNHAAGTFYLLHTRVWELLVGAVLASIEQSRPLFSRKSVQNLFSFLGGLFIALGLATINEATPFPGIWSLLPTLGAMFIIAAGPQAFFNRHILTLRPMVFVGLISYPLYLWHWPLLVFGEYLNFSPWFGLVASIACASATYLFIESPIKEHVPTMAVLKTSRWLVPLTGLVVLVIFAGGVLGMRNRQFIRHSVVFDNLMQDLDWDPARDPACLALPNLPKGLVYCRINPKVPSAEVIIIGDSHADALFNGLSDLYQSKNKGVVYMGLNSCPPFANAHYHNESIDPERCNSATEEIVRYIEGSATLKTVVMGFYYENLHGWDFNEATAPAEIAERMNEVIHRLQKTGKRVVLFQDVPAMGLSPRQCIARPVSYQNPQVSCILDQERIHKAMEESDFFYNRASSSACLFKTKNAFLKGNLYYMVENKRFLYRDPHHLSRLGSLHLAKIFSESPCFGEFLSGGPRLH